MTTAGTQEASPQEASPQKASPQKEITMAFPSGVFPPMLTPFSNGR